MTNSQAVRKFFPILITLARSVSPMKQLRACSLALAHRGQTSSLKNAIFLALSLFLWGAVENEAQSVEFLPATYAASTTTTGWPATNAVDGNPGTVWSSSTYGTAEHFEWFAFWYNEFQDVNYVRMTPRMGSKALGFPTTFYIYWWDGSSWQLARTVSGMQTPYRNDDIILALPTTVHCKGIYVLASSLGTDDVGNYVFQLAEIRAGYEAVFSQFLWVGNDGSANRALVRDVGSKAFDPNKISNWNYDARNPIIVPDPGSGFRNIYAPSVVKNGLAWNIYFGGWDNSSTPNDEISVTVSVDNFATFNSHAKLITHGTYTHVNNENVIKTGTSTWKMAYTTLMTDGGLNRPGFATSNDGVNWTPSAVDTAHLMTMNGYPQWSSADVNGGNAIYYDGAQYHMYFIDFNNSFAVNYATSPDNQTYTFQGTKFYGPVPQDVKSFNYLGTPYYLSVYHTNGASVFYSLNTTLASPAMPAVMFNKSGSADNFITSVGLVSDGTRLWGALYGASPVMSLDKNVIFASWLQRKAVFQNTSTFLAANQSYGPENLYVYMTPGQSVETGQFSIFDTDGTTLLKQTPKVTLLQGDIWRCNF